MSSHAPTTNGVYRFQLLPACDSNSHLVATAGTTQRRVGEVIPGRASKNPEKDQTLGRTFAREKSTNSDGDETRAVRFAPVTNAQVISHLRGGGGGVGAYPIGCGNPSKNTHQGYLNFLLLLFITRVVVVVPFETIITRSRPRPTPFEGVRASACKPTPSSGGVIRET